MKINAIQKPIVFKKFMRSDVPMPKPINNKTLLSGDKSKSRINCIA